MGLLVLLRKEEWRDVVTSCLAGHDCVVLTSAWVQSSRAVVDPRSFLRGFRAPRLLGHNEGKSLRRDRDNDETGRRFPSGSVIVAGNRRCQPVVVDSH
jgi:hypothetical protein